MLPIIRKLFSTVHPFRILKFDLKDPSVRDGMSQFMPEFDLDDPLVQTFIRDFAVPVGVFAEVRRVGQAAWTTALKTQIPTLVIQGGQDPLALPGITRQLISRLPGLREYREVTATHDLTDPTKDAWQEVETTVVEFAERIHSSWETRT
jgi:pimeloyl-ACP methyl ester carboxylesterase